MELCASWEFQQHVAADLTGTCSTYRFPSQGESLRRFGCFATDCRDSACDCLRLQGPIYLRLLRKYPGHECKTREQMRLTTAQIPDGRWLTTRNDDLFT